MAGIVKPTILPYGVSFGKYNSPSLSDYTPSGDLSETLYSESELKSLEEFNQTEREVYHYIMARLGHPTVRVELTPYQIQTCIEEAVNLLNYHAPLWTTNFAAFGTTPNINVYELPQYIADNLTYVNYKKNLLTIQAESGSLEMDYFIKFFQDAHLFSDFSVGDFYILQMHLEMVRKILSQEGHFDLINGKYLQITPTPVSNMQDVILVYRALDSGTLHPAYKLWIKKYALAVAKEVLGEIRGKYETLPGPGGGSKLNGPDLVARAREDKEMLKEELLLEIEEPPLFSTF